MCVCVCMREGEGEAAAGQSPPREVRAGQKSRRDGVGCNRMAHPCSKNPQDWEL